MNPCCNICRRSCTRRPYRLLALIWRSAPPRIFQKVSRSIRPHASFRRGGDSLGLPAAGDRHWNRRTAGDGRGASRSRSAPCHIGHSADGRGHRRVKTTFPSYQRDPPCDLLIFGAHAPWWLRSLPATCRDGWRTTEVIRIGQAGQNTSASHQCITAPVSARHLRGLRLTKQTRHKHKDLLVLSHGHRNQAT